MGAVPPDTANGTPTVAAPGKANLRVYVLNGPGRIGTAGPYLKWRRAGSRVTHGRDPLG